METFQVGEKVRGKNSFQGDEIQFTGMVVGHGVIEGDLFVLVRLSCGGYLKKERETHMFVSVIVAHPDNLEKVDES